MRRALAAGVFLGSLLLLPGAPAQSQQDAPASSILQLQLNGVVDPFVAGYLTEGIDEANRTGRAAVLILVDTPGGLDSAMRQITRATLNSTVPVLCYTAPAGARAASAGAFVMMACPVAAMAPGTNIGAAHPVGASGAIASEKAVSDAAAYMRSLAETYGRNADWAERAVRESVSATAVEALDLQVVDMLAPDKGALLRSLDGREVELSTGRAVTLNTTGLVVEPREMGAGASVLHTLLDPTIAFIFFFLGLGLLVTELFVPGGIVGTLGAVMLVLSVVALGMLPVQLLGMVLLVASVAFFILELKLPGTGLATVGGVTCLVLGALFLFDPSVPNARVSPWVIGLTAVVSAGFFLFVIRAAIRLRSRPSALRTEPLVGSEGVVVRELAPVGVVQVLSEEWTAQSQGGTVPAGRPVRVVAVEGLRLKVVPVEHPAERSAPVPPGTGEGGGE